MFTWHILSWCSRWDVLQINKMYLTGLSGKANRKHLGRKSLLSELERWLTEPSGYHIQKGPVRFLHSQFSKSVKAQGLPLVQGASLEVHYCPVASCVTLRCLNKLLLLMRKCGPVLIKRAAIGASTLCPLLFTSLPVCSHIKSGWNSHLFPHKDGDWSCNIRFGQKQFREELF